MRPAGKATRSPDIGNIRATSNERQAGCSVRRMQAGFHHRLPGARLPRMAIHPDLLEILACPVCKTPVELVKEGAGLRCAQCKRVYPVREDIPIMLPEEATVEG